MKIESIQQNHWYGKLNEENASAIAAEIRRRLDGKKVLIMIDNPSRSDLEYYWDQNLQRAHLYSQDLVEPSDVMIALSFSARNIDLFGRFDWFMVFDGGRIRLDSSIAGCGGRDYRLYLAVME